MPRWIVPLLGASVLVFAVGLVALFEVTRAGGGGKDDPFAQDPNLAELELLDFRLVDQTGTIVDRSIFDGQITILNFFFSHCVLVCPQMNGEMYSLERSLKDLPVQFVSISVDPEHDTVAHLREYAKNFDAEAPRWRFLTGDPGEAERMVREGMHYDLSVDTDETNTITLEDGSTMPNLNHPSRLFLIGPDHKVLGLYSYQDEDDLRELKRRVRAMCE